MDGPTIAIYEAQHATYESKRTPRHRAHAERFGARVTEGLPVDLGCGPGWYTDALGRPAIALDATEATVRRTRAVAPTALAVRADLAALPFRPRSLGGGWARNTYVHLRSDEVPVALADLHRALRVGAPVELTFFGGEVEGRRVFPDDDLPGRWFSTWSEQRLRDVVAGAGFSLNELEVTETADGTRYTVRATRAQTLPDTVGPSMGLLICGLNPSLHAADAGVGFVTSSNRFWRAALNARLVDRGHDPWHALRHRGVGMTDLVKRATPRADALTRAEYRDGVARVERLCAWLEPQAVCVVGLAGWRAAVDRTASPGWQDRSLGGRPVYVMPSTSGLNAATSLDELAEHLRRACGGLR